MKLYQILLGLAIFSMSLAGSCSNPDEPADTIDGEACEHLNDGPFSPITALETADSAAPVVMADHTAYRITLPDLTSGTGEGGYIRLQADEAGDYVLFLDHEVDTITFYESDGVTPFTPEDAATSSAECASIHGRYTLELEVGVVYVYLEMDHEAIVTALLEHVEHQH